MKKTSRPQSNPVHAEVYRKLIDDAQISEDIRPPKFLLDTFGFSESEFWVLYDTFGPHIPRWANNIHQTKYEVGLKLCELAILPHGEYHQQPYDFVRMFPMSLSPDMYEQDELELIELLFILWASKSNQILKSETFDEAIRQIKTMGVKIAYYYGDANKTIRRIELSEALRWNRWFRCTEGCFDLDSGALVDPDRAALREFLETWGQA